jgi:excisionase family DNA binding protein
VTAPKKLRQDGYLTAGQVAHKLKVHRSTVWLWIKAGALPSKRIGQFRAVDPAALKDFLKVYDPKDLAIAKAKKT